VAEAAQPSCSLSVGSLLLLSNRELQLLLLLRFKCRWLPPHLSVSTMRVLKSLSAVTTYPTGDKSFAVQQGFPQPISAEEADPFLMCDHFVRLTSTHRFFALR
jgi:hypothetical protein